MRIHNRGGPKVSAAVPLAIDESITLLYVRKTEIHLVSRTP